MEGVSEDSRHYKKFQSIDADVKQSGHNGSDVKKGLPAAFKRSCGRFFPAASLLFFVPYGFMVISWLHLFFWPRLWRGHYPFKTGESYGVIPEALTPLVFLTPVPCNISKRPDEEAPGALIMRYLK